MYKYKSVTTPIGPIYLVASEEALHGVIFECNWLRYIERHPQLTEGQNIITARTQKQLTEYFNGQRTVFDIPLHIEGTEFQKRVWMSLATIKHGETLSYAEQAQIVGSPKAVRAVGSANGLNPLAIILPCHRVIGSNGKLTGYAGGTDKKQFLLDLECSSHTAIAVNC